MKLVTTYIFLFSFLIGVFQPTIYVLTTSDTSFVISVNNTSDSTGETEGENPKGNSELSDELDDFFHNQSLFHFSFSNINFYLSETTLVSDFTDIIISPPKS